MCLPWGWWCVLLHHLLPPKFAFSALMEKLSAWDVASFSLLDFATACPAFVSFFVFFICLPALLRCLSLCFRLSALVSDSWFSLFASLCLPFASSFLGYKGRVRAFGNGHLYYTLCLHFSNLSPNLVLVSILP